MNTSSMALACSLTVLAPACVATGDLVVSARAVEVMERFEPVVAEAAGLSRVELAELRASVAHQERARRVWLEIRIGDGDGVLVPRMIVPKGEEAIAFVGDFESAGRESGFVVRVAVGGGEVVLTVTERDRGEVIARRVTTVPIEAAASPGTP